MRSERDLTKRERRYLEALALAHMLSPSDSGEEDMLANALNAARDNMDIDDDVIDQFQQRAATEASKR